MAQLDQLNLIAHLITTGMNPKCGKDVCNYDKLSPLVAILNDGLAQKSNKSKRDYLLIFSIIKYFCHGGHLENITK